MARERVYDLRCPCGNRPEPVRTVFEAAELLRGHQCGAPFGVTYVQPTCTRRPRS